MKTEEKGRGDDVKHAGCGSASAPLCSVPPGSDAASPLHLKKTTSPWQPQRTCAHLPACRAVLYVCMHECVLCKHIGSSVTACVPPSDVSLSVSRRVCVCVYQLRACVCVWGRYTHKCTHRASHSVCTAGFIFSTWCLYNQGDTGGNKRKGENISCIFFTVYLFFLLLLSVLLFFPSLFCPLRSFLPRAPCLIIHLTPHFPSCCSSPRTSLSVSLTSIPLYHDTLQPWQPEEGRERGRAGRQKRKM